jgi:hypothetical protein
MRGSQHIKKVPEALPASSGRLGVARDNGAATAFITGPNAEGSIRLRLWRCDSTQHRPLGAFEKEAPSPGELSATALSGARREGRGPADVMMPPLVAATHRMCLE